MKVLDLFSGIGGFALGLERAGMTTAAFCEIEEYPRKVLAKHWPHVPCYTDVRELNATRLTADGITGIDLICGGFPCQPFSVAGKQLGAEDDRHLWPEYFRLIKELRPTWVIGENVVGLVNLGLDAVLDDLESIGYATRTFDIPACGVGAPHERRRLWIVAYANQNIQHDLHRGETGRTRTTKEGAELSSRSGNLAEQTLADTDSERGCSREAWSADAKDAWEPSRRSISGQWNSESGFCRVANGVPARAHRLKALGNAVVPQIPEIIGRAIMQVAA